MNRPKGKNFGDRPLILAFFFLFVFSNGALSYFQLPLVWKLWVFLFGVLLPLMGILFLVQPSGKSSPTLRQEWLPPLPLGMAAALGGILLALRVFNPLTFIAWPLFDETVNGYYALELDRQWSWQPFFFYSQLPPLFIWILCWIFKAIGSMLSAIRLEPILLSILILPAAYAAVRSFFSRSFSILYTFLVGIGFWALFFGRISHQGILMVLWEYLALAALGKSRSSSGTTRLRWLAALGTLLGTGIYTYFAWPFVAMGLAGTAACLVQGQKRQKTPAYLCLLVPALVSVLPFIGAVWGRVYGTYLHDLWSLQGGTDWVFQANTTFACLASFLWGHPTKDFYYGPVWGGFLNPLAGAAFLLGVVELYRRRKQPESRFFFICLPLFLMPALLTNTLTDMREIQALPLMTFAAALGLGVLRERFTGARGAVLLITVVLISGGLDLAHLSRFGSYINGYWKGQKTAESAGAFALLDPLERRQGPGLVLTSYSNDVYTYDQSLLVATYPFNAGMNPRFSAADAHWLAVVTNVHFQPFLTREFPGAQTVWLSRETEMARDNFNGGLMLAVIPMTPANRSRLNAWAETDRLFRHMSEQVMSLPMVQARRETLRILTQALPELPTDPFIRSCYWEMVYFNYNWENLYGDHDVKTNFSGAVGALQRALKEGYPTAYFYNELGSCYVIEGEYGKARAAFEAAVRAPLNLTPAAENLKALDKAGKTPPIR